MYFIDYNYLLCQVEQIFIRDRHLDLLFSAYAGYGCCDHVAGLLGDLLPGLIARKLSGVSGGLWGLGMPSGVGN
jgi:hypothetical protein